jgi:putative membrane protein
MSKLKKSRTVIVGIWVFTIVVYALVMSLHYIPKVADAPTFTSNLPVLHAILNGSCFLLLILSLISVKKRRIQLHKRLNTLAMIFSVLFLLSYVLYHATNNDTTYGGEYSGIYYFILLTHILLAALSLPAILIAYYRGFIGDVQKHRQIVRYTYPVWLYVALTGVLVYFFLAPYY